MQETNRVTVRLLDGRVEEYPDAQAAQHGERIRVHRGPNTIASFHAGDVDSFANHPPPESAAEAQRGFARDNDAIADRLDAAGHRDLAAVYRRTASE